MVNTGPPAFKNFFLRNVFTFHRILLKTWILLGKPRACGSFYFLPTDSIWGARNAILDIRAALGMSSFGQSHQQRVDAHLACWQSWGENECISSLFWWALLVGWSQDLTGCLVKQQLPRHSSMELCRASSHMRVKMLHLKILLRNSLAIQWLRLRASTAGGTGSILG